MKASSGVASRPWGAKALLAAASAVALSLAPGCGGKGKTADSPGGGGGEVAGGGASSSGSSSGGSGSSGASSSGNSAGGVTGDAGATSSGGAPSGSGCLPPHFACWPMPNPASSGLPHAANYEARASVVRDEVTGLVWQRAPGGMLDFPAALAYCQGLTLEGLTWRLPNRIELVSLVDFTRADATIDLEAFPSTSGNFWSATPAATEPDRRAWQVSFSSGATSMTSQSVKKNVRCVQASPPPAAPHARYTLEGQSPDDTLTDLGTKLVWQRTLSDQTFTFELAQSYCSSLTAAGGGWRVPSVAELQTLIDDAKLESPLVDEQALPKTPAGSTLFWSSSKAAGSATAAWFVSFGTGEATMAAAVTGNVIDMPNHVRCVR